MAVSKVKDLLVEVKGWADGLWTSMVGCECREPVKVSLRTRVVLSLGLKDLGNPDCDSLPAVLWHYSSDLTHNCVQLRHSAF